MDDFEDKMIVLEQLSDSCQRVRVPKTPKFSRQDVIEAFASAFQMIGGVPRLALWANENPSDFFKLYAKMLPSAQHLSVSADKSNIRQLSTEELTELLNEQINAPNQTTYQ